MKSKPKLVASFVLKDDAPVATEHQGLKHYRLMLSIRDDDNGVESAFLELHPSYWEKTRELVRTDGQLDVEMITSFGDYDVSATLVTTDGRQVQVRERLSDLLRRSLGDNPSKALVEALESIERH